MGDFTYLRADVDWISEIGSGSLGNMGSASNGVGVSAGQGTADYRAFRTIQAEPHTIRPGLVHIVDNPNARDEANAKQKQYRQERVAEYERKEDLVVLPRAAQILGVDPSYLHGLSRTGKIQVVKKCVGIRSGLAYRFLTRTEVERLRQVVKPGRKRGEYDYHEFTGTRPRLCKAMGLLCTEDCPMPLCIQDVIECERLAPRINAIYRVAYTKYKNQPTMFLNVVQAWEIHTLPFLCDTLVLEALADAERDMHWNADDLEALRLICEQVRAMKAKE